MSFESRRNFIQSEIRFAIPLFHKIPSEYKDLRDQLATVEKSGLAAQTIGIRPLISFS